MSRIDAATVLEVLGYTSLQDFVVESSDGVTATIAQWLHPVDPQPSEATLDAVTQQQIDDFFASQKRQRILDILTEIDRNAQLTRSALLVILDVFNVHALQINAILDAIDTASNFADVKVAIAAIADLPPRTNAQLIAAVQNKINAGEVD